jgi:hypothetical protein
MGGRHACRKVLWLSIYAVGNSMEGTLEQIPFVKSHA